MFRSTTIGALGVVFGLGSVLSQDIIIKNLSDEYSVVQLLFIRSAFALLILSMLDMFHTVGILYCRRDGTYMNSFQI